MYVERERNTVENKYQASVPKFVSPGLQFGIIKPVTSHLMETIKVEGDLREKLGGATCVRIRNLLQFYQPRS